MIARLLAILIIAVPVIIIISYFIYWLRKKSLTDKIIRNNLKKGGH